MTDGDRDGPDGNRAVNRPEDPGAGDDADAAPRDGVGPALRWAWQTDDELMVFARELVKSAVAVGLIGLILFTVSGVWPPMVAVESGSMEPNMHRGDLVFLVEEQRFSEGSAVDGTGVVPYQTAVDSGYRSFGDYGDVLVFEPPRRAGSPIIHRARMYVEEGENWVQRADRAYVGSQECGDTRMEGLPTCPAPHDGFITKGDANAKYDQVQGIAPVVRPSWIRGRAEVRVPWLGHVRLIVSSASATDASAVTNGSSTGVAAG